MENDLGACSCHSVLVITPALCSSGRDLRLCGRLLVRPVCVTLEHGVTGKMWMWWSVICGCYLQMMIGSDWWS